MSAQSFDRSEFSADELGVHPRVRSAPWSRALHELQALNSSYLELLVQAAEWGDFVTLPASLSHAFQRLTSEQLSLIAGCPFSLFDARFDEHELWLSACLNAQSQLSKLTAHETPHRAALEFAQAVLFFGWHLANARTTNGEIGARLLLGMHTATFATLRRLGLATLFRLAPPLVRVLEPRWQTHREFWPGLIRSALQNDLPGLRRIQWLGRQLLAAQGRTAVWR